MRRNAIERKLLAQVVARRHLVDQTSFHVLGDDYGISERDARELYNVARDEDLVRVTVTPTYSAPPHSDPELSLAITAHPSRLRRAIVVDVPVAQEPDEQDEFLHRQLASAAAKHLLDELHDGDTVAVAGGRGPAFTADAVSELVANTRAFADVQLISACGGSIRRLPRHTSTSGALDADVVADALARALNAKPNDTKLVLLPLALADSPALDQVVPTVAPHITVEWWLRNRVDICLVGAGVFTTDPGEYFLQHQNGTHSEAISELLDLLTQKVLRLEEPGIVADVAQRLWLTRDVQNANPADAADLVERINDRLIGADLASLDRAREKILIAGGESKYAALRSIVLSARCDFRPTTLVTDSVTARRLRAEL